MTAPGQWLAGAVNALTALVAILSLGIVASAPLGPVAAQLGVRAAFVAVIAGGLVYALAGSTASPAGSPSSATAVIFAGLVAELGGDPQLGLATAAGLLALVAVLSSAVVLMGLLQFTIGLAGLGRLARFVPQPVLAGFMNGVALVILFSQVPLLAGQLPDPQLGLSSWPALRPAALMLGLVTALLIQLIQRHQPTWPATLLALLAGALVWALLQQGWPALDFGLRLGVGPMSWPLLSALSRDQGAALGAAMPDPDHLPSTPLVHRSCCSTAARPRPAKCHPCPPPRSS